MTNATNTLVYTRTESVIYVADNMRNVLRNVVRDNRLDPTKLMDLWQGPIGRGVQTWLQSGHLTCITIELFEIGSNRALARWDFPINYDGSGIDDDMWSDWDHLSRTLAKADPPPANCTYEIVLSVLPGADHVNGLRNVDFRSVDGLVGRDTGTVIATPHIRASIKYWKSK